jgi:hypothetical protein
MSRVGWRLRRLAVCAAPAGRSRFVIAACEATGEVASIWEEVVRKATRAVASFAIAALFGIGIVARAGADEIVLKAVSAFPRTHENTAGFLKFIDAVNAKGNAFMKTPWGRMKNNPNIKISVEELKRDWY